MFLDISKNSSPFSKFFTQLHDMIFIKCMTEIYEKQQIWKIFKNKCNRGEGY